MTDRWDLQSLGHRQYDQWLTEVGPQQNHETYRCFCCHAPLNLLRAVRHLVCQNPDCVAWWEDGQAELRRVIAGKKKAVTVV